MKKLHLGSGGLHIDEYINTDLVELDGVDMVLDASKVPYPFDDDTLDEVFSSHMIEHLWHEAIPPMIQEWYRILKKGGRVVCEFPDFDEALELYKKGEVKKAMDMIYGNNERPSQHHQWGWNFDRLYRLFDTAGFAVIYREESFDYHQINFDIPTVRVIATK